MQLRDVRLAGRALAGARALATWVAAPLAMAYLTGRRLRRHRPRVTPLLDLDVYKLAAETALRGGDPYTVATRIGFLFVYPPFALLLALPLTLVGLGTAGLLWNALGLVALQGSARVALEQIGVAHAVEWALAVTAAATGLSPVEQTLQLGQVSLLLMGLVVADLARPASAPLKGTLIGVATGVKLVPGVFVPHLLAARQPRAALVAVLTAAATTLAGTLAFPTASRDFWSRYAFDAERVIPVHWPPNESLRAMVTRMRHSGAAAVRPWIVASAAVLAAAVLVTALTASGPEAQLGVVATALAGLLVSPVSHHHYWVWSVPVSIWLTGAARRTRSTLLGACVAGPLLVLAARVNHWAVPGPTADPDPMLRLRPRANLAVNSVTIATLLQLGGITAHVLGPVVRRAAARLLRCA